MDCIFTKQCTACTKFSESAVLIAELIHMECDLFGFNNILFSPRKYHNKIKWQLSKLPLIDSTLTEWL